MKNLNKFGFILFLAVAAIFSSCSSDDNGGGSASLGQVKANGFKSIEQGTQAIIATSGTSQTMQVIGANASGKTIQLVIFSENNIAPGTYNIVDADGIYSASASYTEFDMSNPIDSETWYAPYDAEGNLGEIKITSISSTNVQGTFNFTGKTEAGDTKTISNGSFNVNFSSN